MKINVLGSCVSRVSLLRGERELHGVYGDTDVDLEYFLDKHNMVMAVMPPAFVREEVMQIQVEELWDKSRLKSVQQLLMKDTIPLLLESEAEYLVIDLYDFHNCFVSYENTAMATGANEFVRTKLFEKYQDKMQMYASLFDIPTWMWYSYVDVFFEKIKPKYDSNHIILNRFRANTYCLAQDGTIGLIPQASKQEFQCNDKYNVQCRALEEYIIKKINPYVIDLSNYFMGDQNIWPDNLNGAHFEKEFYRETYDQIMRIVHGEAKDRYYDQHRFFNYERDGVDEDRRRKFDVDGGIGVLDFFLKENDILWMNMLDKLCLYAPEDERVKALLNVAYKNGLIH